MKPYLPAGPSSRKRASAPESIRNSWFTGNGWSGISDCAEAGAAISAAHAVAAARAHLAPRRVLRSEEHTSELQSLMRISYAVFCLKKKNHTAYYTIYTHKQTERT